MLWCGLACHDEVLHSFMLCCIVACSILCYSILVCSIPFILLHACMLHHITLRMLTINKCQVIYWYMMLYFVISCYVMLCHILSPYDRMTVGFLTRGSRCCAVQICPFTHDPCGMRLSLWCRAYFSLASSDWQRIRRATVCKRSGFIVHWKCMDHV